MLKRESAASDPNQEDQAVNVDQEGGLSLDFSQVDSFEPLPAGRYAVAVINCSVKQSKADKPYLSWELTVNDGAYLGRRLFYNSSLQSQALWSLARDLRAMGFQLEDHVNLNPAELVGEEVGVIVSQREYRGELTNNVDSFIPLSEVERGDSGNPAF